MLTAEQVKSITFASGFNGYKEAEVDRFLDECAETIENLTLANEDMKRKMKVLADKLVEYRREENNIHSALMNAQRMGDSVIREANQKASLILDDAKAKAEKILEKTQSQIEAKKQELIQTEKEVALFKDRLMALYREHLEMIQALPEPEAEEAAEEPAPVEEEPIAEPEPEPIPDPIPTPVAIPAEEMPIDAEPEEEFATEDSFVLHEAEVVPITESLFETIPEEEELPEKSGRFSDLQFGDDYSVTEEKRGFFKRKK